MRETNPPPSVSPDPCFPILELHVMVASTASDDTQKAQTLWLCI